MVTCLDLGVTGYQYGLLVTDKSADGDSARQGDILYLIAGDFSSLHDIEFCYIGIGECQALDIGDISIEHHLVNMAGGNLLFVDDCANIQFFGHVDVVNVLNLCDGLGYAETFGSQTGQNVGFRVVGQGHESLGVFYSFTQKQAGITAVAVNDHYPVIAHFGQLVAAVHVTLDYLEVHVVGHELWRAEQLSKGNQQKVQLMAALLSDPEFVILDEPMSGLDPVNTDLFKEVIRDEISKDKYVIMSSHQMPTIEEFCSDITIMNRGNVVLQGNLNEIKKSYGRVNLFVKCEQPIDQFIEAAGLTVIEETPAETQLRVTGEEQAMAFLNTLITNKITVIRFDLREPSLHEIFVEKVGAGNEEQ